MIRATIAAIVGFGFTVVVLIALITVLLMMVSKEFVFPDDSLVAGDGYSLVTVAIGGAAAFAGGYLAAWIAGDRASRAVSIMIGVIVLLGIISLGAEANEPPTPESFNLSEATLLEAAPYGIQPTWVGYANVAVGVVATFLGGRARAFRRTEDRSSVS